MTPSAIPAPSAVVLRLPELLVEHPLQPAVEVDRVGAAGCELGDRRCGRVLEAGRPVLPIGPCASVSAHQVA